MPLVKNKKVQHISAKKVAKKAPTLKTTKIGVSTRRTTDLRRPVTKTGKKDKRYALPEFCNKNGTRDKRCTRTAKR